MVRVSLLVWLVKPTPERSRERGRLEETQKSMTWTLMLISPVSLMQENVRRGFVFVSRLRPSSCALRPSWMLPSFVVCRRSSNLKRGRTRVGGWQRRGRLIRRCRLLRARPLRRCFTSISSRRRDRPPQSRLRKKRRCSVTVGSRAGAVDRVT